MAEFSEIYRSYERPLFRFLLALTGDGAMAEELVQETFYQAFLHIDQFEGRSQFLTWLCQIGKNAWLKECRRNKRYCQTPVEELVMPDPSLSPEERLIKAQEQRRLREALSRLQEPYREVFLLRVCGDFKLKEIAALYQKSESWARVTFFRAKNLLAKEVME